MFTATEKQEWFSLMTRLVNAQERIADNLDELTKEEGKLNYLGDSLHDLSLCVGETDRGSSFFRVIDLNRGT